MTIFYRARRVGRYGVPFTMFKFRTMCEGADKIGGPSTSGDDPRLTPVGKWLRRFKLDELPQLLNVLRGEMSLVGPRPEVKEVIDLLTPEEKAVILSVKPGITDLASLWNHNEEEILRGEADPHQAYLDKIWPEKKRLQIEGIRNKSLWYDTKIVIRTLWRIIRK